MRVVVVGATGNVGTSLIPILAEEQEVTSVLGLARREPKLSLPKTSWAGVDVSRDDLTPHFRDADVVVHLSWLIQPSRRVDITWETNVLGSRRIFDAAAKAGVPSLVYASSVATYSPGPKDRAVDESWPTEGVGTLFYSRHKVQVERILDDFEATHPDTRVVRLRTALIFKRESATGQRRLFAGPLLPGSLARPELLPIVPDIASLRFQALHSGDAGAAYALAILKDVRGAFNVAAEPVIDPRVLGELLGAHPVKMSPRMLRGLADVTWRLHLQPSPPGWLDAALSLPVMDSSRAHTELGWRPRYSARDALRELFAGLRDASGIETPPLSPSTSGRGRVREFLTGIGRRSGL
jgi:UDP-glucose 4-epimerase